MVGTNGEKIASVVGRDPTTGRALEIRMDASHISEVSLARNFTSQEKAAVLPWVTPGYIDLQVNGYQGHDLNGTAVTPQTVVDLTQALARAGTTTFVPTIITGSEEAIIASLRAVAAARAEDEEVARTIPFAHVEGPFIAEDDGPRGAHDLSYVRSPSLAELDRWQDASGNLVGIVTISPHHPEAVTFTAGAVERGVRVAVGHTSATPEQISAVVDAGARLATHLGNGAHATMPRHPNYIWTQLADDRLTASFIADGHHVPAATLKAMLRAKGLDRAFLVSDSVALAGMPPGEYTTPVGGEVELTADGRLAVPGTPYLAGAARNLAECVATAINLAGLSVADGVRLATKNPAQIIAATTPIQTNTDPREQPLLSRTPSLVDGSIAPGQPADILLLDPLTSEVLQVIKSGKRVN